MSYWIFKLAEQELYADEHGKTYVYDNTHSVRVAAGDEFLYLDKRSGYSFTGAGKVARVSSTAVTEGRTPRVRTILTAHLQDVVVFARPLSINPRSAAGRVNRSTLGLVDVNLLGWSHSIPSLEEAMFDAILGLAELPAIPPGQQKPDYTIEDRWAKVRVRQALTSLRRDVFARDGSSCLVCGTQQPEVLELAHLSPYATDKHNRANPANAVCLCSLCHRALDRRLIGFNPDGSLRLSERLHDAIAKAHFTAMAPAQRLPRLAPLSAEFLALTAGWVTMSGSRRK